MRAAIFRGTVQIGPERIISGPVELIGQIGRRERPLWQMEDPQELWRAFQTVVIFQVRFPLIMHVSVFQTEQAQIAGMTRLF